MLGLEWKDVDFENNIISVRRTSNYTAKQGVYTDTTKTRRSQRTLKFPQEIMDMLKEYKEQQDAAALRLGDKWVETDRLYVKWNGEPIQNGTPYFWLGEFCEKHDLPFYGLHSFRHTNASIMISSGVPITTTAKRLGHSTSATTMYGYLYDDDHIFKARFEDKYSLKSEAEVVKQKIGETHLFGVRKSVYEHLKRVI